MLTASLGIPLAGQEAGLVSTGLLSCWTPTPDLAGPNLSLRGPHIPEAPPNIPYPALLLIAQWILATPIPTRPGSPPAPSHPFWPHHLVLDAASRPLKPSPQPGAGVAPSSLPRGSCTAGSGPHQSRSPPPPYLAQSGAQGSTWALPAPGRRDWTRVPPTHVDARPPADSSGPPPALRAPGSQAEKS